MAAFPVFHRDGVRPAPSHPARPGTRPGGHRLPLAPTGTPHTLSLPPVQAGSLIVDNLRTYGQPVMVYLPPGCELRGGAWVVIDSQINADMVEMYADNSAQVGGRDCVCVVVAWGTAGELQGHEEGRQGLLRLLPCSWREGLASLARAGTRS